MLLNLFHIQSFGSLTSIVGGEYEIRLLYFCTKTDEENPSFLIFVSMCKLVHFISFLSLKKIKIKNIPHEAVQS